MTFSLTVRTLLMAAIALALAMAAALASTATHAISNHASAGDPPSISFMAGGHWSPDVSAK